MVEGASNARLAPGTLVDGRYRVLRLIGRGGMGLVYQAEHTLLHRKVALKLLRPGLQGGEQALSRFHREAMAAASVGNQHVVSVLDMGRLDDGSSYIVMEYLEGADLGFSVARDGPLEIARAVTLILQLCDALSAVHTAGIVHRDLKPENVFLTQTASGSELLKVLDFGICKVLDAQGQGAALTTGSAPLGTPHYMAPEQVAGAAVDPRADVYAVGATLFFALTGQTPFDASSLPALFRQICETPAPDVRSLRSEVSGELAAIVARALAKQPEQRFADAGALAAALAHVDLGGARQPPSATTTVRPVEITAAISSGLRSRTLWAALIAGALVLALWIARDRAAEARTLPNLTPEAAEQIALELGAKFPQLSAAQRERVLQAIREAPADALGSRASRAAAQGDLQVALQLWRQVYEDSSKQQLALGEQRGRAARNLGALSLATNAAESLSWYRRATELDGADLDAWLGLGEAAQNAGTVAEAEQAFRALSARAHAQRSERVERMAYLRLGRVLKAQGKLAESRKAYETSFELIRASTAAQPEDLAQKEDLAEGFVALGDVLKMEGKLAEAHDMFANAVSLRRRLAQAEPADPGRQHELSVNLVRLGRALRAEAKLAEALSAFKEAAAIAEPLARAAPSNLEVQRNLGVCYERMGDALKASGQLGEARRAYEDSAAIAKRLAEADPTNTKSQRNLSVCYNKLGSVQRAEGKLSEAGASYEQAMRIATQLSAADLGNRERLHDLSVSHELLGMLRMEQGRVGEARALYERSAELAQQLAAADPTNLDAQREVSVMLNKLGDTQLAQLQPASARKSYESGLLIMRKLTARERDNTDLQRDLAYSQRVFGHALLAEGKLEEARRAYQEALVLTSRLASLDGANADDRAELAELNLAHGDLFFAERRMLQARQAYSQGVELARALSQADPNNTANEQRYEVALGKLGDAWLAHADTRAARIAYEEALQIARRLAAPDHAEHLRDLAVMHQRIGRLRLAEHDAAGAAASLEHARAIGEQLVKLGADSPRWQRELALGSTAKANSARPSASSGAAPP